jgi:predicted small secreted protein
MRTILILSILLASCSKTCFECNAISGAGYPIEVCDDLATTQVAPNNFVSFYVNPDVYMPMLEQNGYKCVEVN